MALLDERSLCAAVAGLDVRTELLGACAALDDEIDRLAAMAQAPRWWIGHSLGAIVALQLAARHPHAVAGLVLLAANARAAPASSRARRLAQWELAQRQGLRELALCKLGPGYGLHAGDLQLESLADQADTIGVARFGHQLAYAGGRPTLVAQGPWIGVPVLALSGADDTLCPPLQSDEIVALALPGTLARHKRLALGAHLFPMQQPAWVQGRLRAFFILHTRHESNPCEGTACSRCLPPTSQRMPAG
jgi:pimeloyl-ACP methyl ester carboxylesterase